MSLEDFNNFLLAMSAVALVVFVALYFIKAGYGMFCSQAWDVTLNNKLVCMLMEAPVLLVMAWL